MEIDGEVMSQLQACGYDINSFRYRSCVYVLRAGHGPVKVGVSKSVFSRVAALNRGRAVPAEIYSLHPTVRPYHIEQFAHERMASHRVEGEWFDVPPQFAARIVEDCIGHIEHGLDLTDLSASSFSRVWELTGLVEGDWPAGDGFFAEGIEPARSWLEKRNGLIKRLAAAGTADAAR